MKSKNLCIGQKSSFCAVYVNDGPIADDKTFEQIQGFEKTFASGREKDIQYSWVWMNIAEEPEFKSALEKAEEKLAGKEGRDVEELKFPTLMMVKPAKKKR